MGRSLSSALFPSNLPCPVQFVYDSGAHFTGVIFLSAASVADKPPSPIVVHNESDFMHVQHQRSPLPKHVISTPFSHKILYTVISRNSNPARFYMHNGSIVKLQELDSLSDILDWVQILPCFPLPYYIIQLQWKIDIG